MCKETVLILNQMCYRKFSNSHIWFKNVAGSILIASFEGEEITLSQRIMGVNGKVLGVDSVVGVLPLSAGLLQIMESHFFPRFYNKNSFELIVEPHIADAVSAMMGVKS